MHGGVERSREERDVEHLPTAALRRRALSSSHSPLCLVRFFGGGRRSVASSGVPAALLSTPPRTDWVLTGSDD
jgi:hypothetical protein